LLRGKPVFPHMVSCNWSALWEILLLREILGKSAHGWTSFIKKKDIYKNYLKIQNKPTTDNFKFV
jgi:hypothetical protein